MNIISNVDSLQKKIIKLKQSAKTVGFVPTMGFLHDGHISLIKKARQDCDIVVVSIFVNPLQFGPKEDFKRYPRSFKKDSSLCRKYADILFLPTAKTMYSEDFLSLVEVRKLSDILCGASRPGHFIGVTTVVNKLFNIVLPDIAYFGQKDAQQAIIIKKMVKDLNMPIKIKVLPTVRELDGLAMSSRNSYLSSAERKEAVVLYESLILARNLIKDKVSSSKMITAKMRKLILGKKSARIDYISIVHPVTLAQINNIKNEVLVLLAVFIGKTRLIDNIVVRVR